MATVAYLRVSTSEQREQGTIQSQRDAVEEYARRNGWELTETFADDGVSGAIPLGERPEGGRLLAACEAGLVDRVVIYRLDRLGRDALGCLLAIRRLKALKVAVESANEVFDDSPSGRFQTQVMAAVGELERELINDRMTRGRQKSVRSGNYISSRVPFGYKRTGPGQIVIDEAEAEVVRLIFRLATEENLGSHEVAARLDALGIPPPRGGTRYGGWSWSTVAKLTRAARYKGEGGYGKGEHRLVMSCPAIVDAETFAAAQAAGRERRSNSTRNCQTDYRLRGLLWCRTCGGRFEGYKAQRGRHDGRQNGYQCSRRRCHGPKAGHEGTVWRVKEEAVAPVIQKAMEAVLWGDAETLAALDLAITVEREHSSDGDAEVTRLEEKLADLAEQEGRLVDLRVRGTVDGPRFDEHMRRIKGERAAAEASLRELRETDGDDLGGALEWLRAMVSAGTIRHSGKYIDEHGRQFDEPDAEGYAEMLSRTVERAWVEPDGSLTIEGPARLSHPSP